MGPDEYPTRDELGVVVRLLLAKVQQQAEALSTLTGLLVSKGVLSQESLLELLERVKASPASGRMQQSLQALRDFEASHNILKRYEESGE